MPCSSLFRNLFAAFFAASAISFTAISCPPERTIDSEYIVQFRENSNPGLPSVSSKLKALTALDYRALDQKRWGINKAFPFSAKAHALDSPRVYLVRADLASLNRLRQDADIESVEPNCLFSMSSQHSTVIPNDPLLTNNSSLEQIQLYQAWATFNNASAIRVAVIDTGVDLGHPDLIDNLWVNRGEAHGRIGVDDDQNGIVDDLHGADITNLDGDPSPGDWIGAGHGTHVAGIIGARGNNSIGLSGVAWAVQLMPIKVFPDSSEDASLADIIQGIYYAVAQGAHVINLSLGARKVPSAAETEAYRYAFERDVAVVVAAGNNADDSRFYSPGNIQGVINVGAVNSFDELSGFSNYGTQVDILAPGGETNSETKDEELIYSTLPIQDGSYGGLKGTSMAAPYVSGTLALLRTLKPELNLTDLRDALLKGADLIEVNDNDYFKSPRTYPRLNVAQSLKALTTPVRCTDEIWCRSSATEPKPKLGMVEKPTMPGGCQLSQHRLAQQNASTNPYTFLLIPLVLLGIRSRRD